MTTLETDIHTPWSGAPWTRVAIYGLGASGRAAARLLRAGGIDVTLWDDRPREAFDAVTLDGDVTVVCGGDDVAARDLASKVDALVVSPGVPADRPLIRAIQSRNLPIIAEVELAFAQVDPVRDSVVAITGSNGKSTTTALTGAMLEAAGRRASVCGNFGPPLADAVADRSDSREGRDFVVELSSFQLESTDTFRPRAAALLNLSADHIDRHGDLAAYRAAKAHIFQRQSGDDVAVLNADDPAIADLAVPGRRRHFSRRGPVADGCFVQDAHVVEQLPGQAPAPLFALDDLPIDGTHNLENAMAAALLARSLDVESADIVRGLRAFRGLPHRSECVAIARGVRYIDDSKATNVGATIACLDGFADGTVHLILGGRTKGSDFTELVAPVVKKARRVYFIGEAASAIDRALAPALESAGVPRVQAGDLAHAVAAAAATARSGDVVLLSPACASFDQFTGFAARGRTFQRLVAKEVGDGA